MAKSYSKHLSFEIPEPNHTANARFLLVLFIKVNHVTHSCETRKQNTGLCFRATWSIYVSFIYGLYIEKPIAFLCRMLSLMEKLHGLSLNSLSMMLL